MNAPRDSTTVAAFYALAEHSCGFEHPPATRQSPPVQIAVQQASRLSRILARRPSCLITEYGRSKRASPLLLLPSPRIER